VKVIVCIPARYASTRFPGKVLAKDTGKFLIQHTYEQACKAKLPQKVIIAADDKRIAEAAKSFGAECIMTSPDCPSGADRIAEAMKKLGDRGQGTGYSKDEELNPEPCTLNPDDIVVNLQADEPEIDPANIDTVAQLLLENQNCGMATLVAEFNNESQIADPNIVKVVVAWSVQRIADRKKLNAKRYPLPANCGKAIYFSRSPIPFDRQSNGIGAAKNYLRHLGIYAYRKDFLLEFTKLPQGRLEQIEKLEQLRAIENGFDILVAKVEHTCDGIDTPQQYAAFVRRYKLATEKT
jgi:3-deoxy-manno-octulosonate cytidylyltransferase (CMP-KDO synthetase)